MNKDNKFNNKGIRKFKSSETPSERTPMIPITYIMRVLENNKPTEVVEGNACGLPVLVLKYDNVTTQYGSINGTIYAVDIDKYDSKHMKSGEHPKIIQHNIDSLINKSNAFYRSRDNKSEGAIVVDGLTENLKYLDIDMLEYAGSMWRADKND